MNTRFLAGLKQLKKLSWLERCKQEFLDFISELAPKRTTVYVVFEYGEGFDEHGSSLSDKEIRLDSLLELYRERRFGGTEGLRLRLDSCPKRILGIYFTESSAKECLRSWFEGDGCKSWVEGRLGEGPFRGSFAEKAYWEVVYYHARPPTREMEMMDYRYDAPGFASRRRRGSWEDPDSVVYVVGRIERIKLKL